ncbi:MAG: restriction endonuclease subunit S [bacterium]
MMEREEKKNSDLPEGWETEPFVNTIEKFKAERIKQIQANAYLSNGKYPIIDQGQELIAGWSNDKFAIIKDGLPLIIFGDHTRIFKYIDFPFAIGADGTKLIKPQSRFDARYFYYYLLILDIQSKGYSRHYKILKENNVNYPPLPEQEKIAAILYKIQQAIEAQDEIIKKTMDLKKSTMQFLFTRGIYGEKTKQTEIGEMPESWRVIKLEQIASIERGKFTHRPRNDPSYYGGGTPFIQTGDITRSNGRIRTFYQTLNERGLSVSKIFPTGTILITIAANIGDTGILEFDSAFPDSIIGLTPFKGISNEYLEYYLRTQKYQMNESAPKGTQKNINIEFLKPWPIKLPSYNEQKEIATILWKIDQKIELAERKKQTLNNLFQSMLNQLMTGKIRVGNINFIGLDNEEIQR